MDYFVFEEIFKIILVYKNSVEVFDIATKAFQVRQKG